MKFVLSATPVATFMRAAMMTLVLSAAALAHEGHDHGDSAPPQSAGLLPRGEARSDSFELVVTAQGNELTIYIDNFRTNAPVENATVQVEGPQGPANATAEGPGTYHLVADWLPATGHIDLVITIMAGGNLDILPVSFDLTAPASDAAAPVTLIQRLHAVLGGSVVAAGLGGVLLGALAASLIRRRRHVAAVAMIAGGLLALPVDTLAHEDHDHGDEPAAVATGDRAQRLPDGSVIMPKPVQRILDLRTMLTENGVFSRAIELPGRIIPDPNASGFVQTAVGGRLSAPPGGFPPLGRAVKKGDILAYVTPPLQAIDASDIQQRRGEIDQQINITQRRLERFETLAPSGAIARAQLEETRFELEGLQQRRKSLDQMQRLPEELVAPVSGIIADGAPVAGQIAQSSSVVFQIVDPARLWVEALSFAALERPRQASALVPAASGAPRVLPLTFIGSGFADRNQAVAVHFAIEGQPEGLRAGQFLTVFTQAGDEQRGIAVPRTSVIRAANGQDIVFEHTTAERFVPRIVRTMPLDAGRVVILSGLAENRRVVVQGAELLDQVR